MINSRNFQTRSREVDIGEKAQGVDDVRLGAPENNESVFRPERYSALTVV